MTSSGKRTRKLNFSENETTKLLLLELVDSNIDCIKQTINTLKANELKKKKKKKKKLIATYFQ